MRSGRIAASSLVTAAKNCAVSQFGPSRSTSAGKNGVCGTPNAPRISATNDLPGCVRWVNTMMLGLSRSVEPSARAANHLRPFFGILLDQFGKLLGRAARRLIADLREAVAEGLR